jgi:hypothetical protein
MLLKRYPQPILRTVSTLRDRAQGNQPLIRSTVVAMVLMGDPSHVSGQPFDAGTAKKTGLFPRQNLAACPAAQTVSFCDDNDE